MCDIILYHIHHFDVNVNERSGTEQMVKTKNSKNSRLKTVLITVACVLAVAIIGSVFTYTLLGNNGYFLRHTVAVKSENYEVNNAQMSYFFTTNLSSELSKNSTVYQYYGLDTSKSLKTQNYPSGGTWYDYFMQSVTIPSVKQMLTLCEQAKSVGFELSDDDRASIDESIQTIKDTASQRGYSVSQYVMNYYGYGVNLKDVRSAMEMSQLAYSYYNSVMDSYEHSDSDLAGYFSEHENDFLKIDYLSYTFKVSDVKNADTSTDTDTSADTDTSTDTAASTDTPETADSTSADTETSADTSTDTSAGDAESTDTDASTDTSAESKEEDEDAEYKAQIKASADSLAAITDVEQFKAYVENYLKTVVYVSETDTDKLDGNVTSAMSKLETKGASYSEDSDEIKALFDMTEANKTFLHTHDDGTCEVYLLTAPKYREEYTTKNARVIALSSSDSGSITSTIDTINEALNSAEDKDAKFIELADEYSRSTAKDALYENIGKDDFDIDEMNAWLWDESRADGDRDIFSKESTSSSTSTSSTTYYYIVMYKGDGMTKWKYDVDTAMKNAQYEEAYKGFEEAHGGDKITVNLDNIYKIPTT